MDVKEVVASTRDPAFAEDSEGTIVAWNEAAEQLFGYRREDVIGRSCWEVLGGKDIYGNRYCGAHCPLRDNAFLGEPIHTAQVDFGAAGGKRVLVRTSCVLLGHPIRSRTCLVHLLSPAEPREETLVDTGAPPPHRGEQIRLSSRQQEVLKLLVEGHSTREISDLLGIRVATTRNHIQAVLAKLKVNNRLAATILARRLGLA